VVLFNWRTRHKALLFLPGHRLNLALARARVGLGALSTDRQASDVALPAVALGRSGVVGTAVRGAGLGAGSLSGLIDEGLKVRG